MRTVVRVVAFCLCVLLLTLALLDLVYCDNMTEEKSIIPIIVTEKQDKNVTDDETNNQHSVTNLIKQGVIKPNQK